MWHSVVKTETTLIIVIYENNTIHVDQNVQLSFALTLSSLNLSYKDPSKQNTHQFISCFSLANLYSINVKRQLGLYLVFDFGLKW